MGEVVVPGEPPDTYEALAAFYSGFSFCEHYRKIVLAQCRELVRADAAVREERISEARTDDLARTHPAYLDYLTRHLRGRMKWEKAFLAQGGMR